MSDDEAIKESIVKKRIRRGAAQYHAPESMRLFNFLSFIFS